MSETQRPRLTGLDVLLASLALYDNDPACPECGSIDICQDHGSGQNHGMHGWVCDHCGHEWDMETTSDPEEITP